MGERFQEDTVPSIATVSLDFGGTRGPTGLPVVSGLDVALGCPLGTEPSPPTPARVNPDPVAALRDELRLALLRPPCIVAFSGGRDSSLLLAAAADLAAREGLEPPVALTLRYPDDPIAEESGWQDLVIGHLRAKGLRTEWIRRDITTELDILGPLAVPVIRAHGGPTFPAALGNTILLATYAAGGCLVTGNLGDEVVGEHRMGVLRAVVRRRARGMSRDDWRLAIASVGPRSTGRLSRDTYDAPWLRPGPRRRAVREARLQGRQPLWWHHSVRRVLASRAVAISGRTRALISADRDCRLIEPLGAADFVASYAAFGGRWGGVTRTGGIRMLADGLLPESIIRRWHKAWFNASRFGSISRAFARSWDGRGVDHDMIDAERLRGAWLAEVPPATTGMLLQQAYLASAAGTS
jgi:hypothetical protein